MWVTGDGSIWVVADYPALQQSLGKSDEETNEGNADYYDTDAQDVAGALDLLLLVNETVYYSQGTVQMLDYGPLITVDATDVPALRCHLLLWGNIEDAVQLHRQQKVLCVALLHEGMNVFVRGEVRAA